MSTAKVLFQYTVSEKNANHFIIENVSHKWQGIFFNIHSFFSLRGGGWRGEGGQKIVITEVPHSVLCANFSP